MNHFGEIARLYCKCGKANIWVTATPRWLMLERTHDQFPEYIVFADHPELRDIYNGGAWDITKLSALLDEWCEDSDEEPDSVMDIIRRSLNRFGLAGLVENVPQSKEEETQPYVPPRF